MMREAAVVVCCVLGSGCHGATRCYEETATRRLLSPDDAEVLQARARCLRALLADTTAPPGGWRVALAWTLAQCGEREAALAEIARERRDHPVAGRFLAALEGAIRAGEPKGR